MLFVQRELLEQIQHAGNGVAGALGLVDHTAVLPLQPDMGTASTTGPVANGTRANIQQW